MLMIVVFPCVCVCLCVSVQTGRLDVAENFQNPAAAECLSLNHAGPETHSRQVNPPELAVICSPPTPSLPPSLPPRSHVPSPSPSRPLPRRDRSRTLLALRPALHFFLAEIINAPISQTVHIHFTQRTGSHTRSAARIGRRPSRLF